MERRSGREPDVVRRGLAPHPPHLRASRSTTHQVDLGHAAHGAYPEPDPWWPGGRYVDSVGIDAYNAGSARDWGGWTEFGALTRRALAAAHRIAPTKPVMIAETASSTLGENTRRRSTRPTCSSRTRRSTRSYGSTSTRTPTGTSTTIPPRSPRSHTHTGTGTIGRQAQRPRPPDRPVAALPAFTRHPLERSRGAVERTAWLATCARTIGARFPPRQLPAQCPRPRTPHPAVHAAARSPAAPGLPLLSGSQNAPFAQPQRHKPTTS